jgi:hypothetical protein
MMLDSTHEGPGYEIVGAVEVGLDAYVKLLTDREIMKYFQENRARGEVPIWRSAEVAKIAASKGSLASSAETPCPQWSPRSERAADLPSTKL